MQRTDLSSVPSRQRRQLAILLLPVSVVLLAAGVLLGWGGRSLAGQLVGVLVAVIALILLGVGYGLLSSARRDEREHRLDEAIRATTGPCGGDCGSSGSDGCGSDGCGVTDCAVKALPRR